MNIQLNIINEMAKCSYCGRKILLIVNCFGYYHNASIGVICAECLKTKGIDEEYKKKSPEEAKRIEEWLS